MEIQDASLAPSLEFDTERFKQLYKIFDSYALARLPQIYSATIIFKDPIHQLQGIAALNQYFARFCNPEIKCEFEIHNEIISHDQAFFQWQMHYQHPRIKSGKPLTLNGGTLIKFNSKIVYHEDFYDMGAMIYQHLPVLGWAVKKINTRIARAQVRSKYYE
jgi:hypothetical protein